MRIPEHVPGEVLVLEVGSQSRPHRVTHYLSLTYNDEGNVANVACTCESFSFRGRCHHAASVADLMGRMMR